MKFLRKDTNTHKKALGTTAVAVAQPHSKTIPTLRDQNKYKKQPRLSTFKRGLFLVLNGSF